MDIPKISTTLFGNEFDENGSFESFALILEASLMNKERNA